MTTRTHRIHGPPTLPRIKTSGDWPKLKAKAAASRHAVEFARVLSAEFNSGSRHDRRRLAICELLERVYQITYEEGRFVSDNARQELAYISETFMVIYEKLSKEAFHQNIKRWKLVHKFHLMQHLLEDQIPNYGNAKWYWTYSDEDMQKVCKEIGLSLHPSTICSMLLYKWGCIFFCDSDSEHESESDDESDIVVVDDD